MEGVARARVAGGAEPGRSPRTSTNRSRLSAGPADRTGNRVARAAGKKQTRRKSAGRGAKRSRTRPVRKTGSPPRARAGSRVAAKRPRRKVKRVAKAGSAKRRSTAKRTTARATARPKAAPRATRKRQARAVRAAAPAREPMPPRRSAARRDGATAPPAAFSVQREGASLRDQLLFEIQRARASVKAAIQGLTPASAGRPIAPGKWSPLEIVLHLSERDRVRLEEFARTIGGQPRTWAGISDAEQSAVNEAHLAPLRAHTWDDAVRRLDALREALLLRLHEVPALPDDVWRRGHPFADMMWGLPEHDRHHAGQLKRARVGEPTPVED